MGHSRIRHPDKPPRGSSPHREWLLVRIRRFARIYHPLEIRRDPWIQWERKQPALRACIKDLDPYGGWTPIRDEILAEMRKEAPPPVDVSGLDFDDVGDTEPDPPTIPRKPDKAPVVVTSSRPARVAEPSEVMAARRALAGKQSADSKVRLLADELEKSEARCALLAELSSVHEIEPIVPHGSVSGRREAAAVVLCSDWHVEEVVRAEMVEGRNAYGPAIAHSRVERLLTGILWLVAMHRERFEIPTLVLWLGGDLMSGYIHEELEETNALTPPETVVICTRLIAGLIEALLERGEFERIVVPCNVGNHGRTTRRTRAKTAVKNSYEYIIYHQLAARFANEPRVQFEIAAGGHVYLDVYDTSVRFHHGDDVKYYGGVGGLSIPLNKAIAGWQSFKPADLTVIGHFHQLLHGRDFVVNGSLVGYSEFALRIKAKYEPPQQAFFLIDKTRGRTCASPIWVEERDRDWSK